MRRCILRAVLPIAVIVATAQGGDRSLEVRLVADGRQYVVGEAVSLVASVRNVSTRVVEAREVHVEDTEPEIAIALSTDGKEFHPYIAGIFGNMDYLKDYRPIAPQEEKAYRLRVLYASDVPHHLALPQPGYYWIKAVYPLNEPGSRPAYIESNAVRIEVASPRGADAEAWNRLRHAPMLRFVHSGRIERGEAGPIREAIEVLTKYPSSRYADDLRWALRKYHDDRASDFPQEEAGGEPALPAIRKALGLEEMPPGPFPEDGRLDVKLTYRFAVETPLETVLQEITRQTGVPLDIDPELRWRTMYGSSAGERTLRSFMGFHAIQSNWIRRGEGYRLVPAAAREAQPPDGE